MESGEGRDLENDDFSDLKQQLLFLEREYNFTRQSLFVKTQRYYRQSIGSKYVKEEDIRKLLNQCEEIKQSYFRIQTELMSKRPKQKWSFKDNFKISSQF